MVNILIGFSTVVAILVIFGYIGYWQYRRILREAKNYERGLKMVPMLIHLPPSSDDIEGNGRDARDVAEEAISQAQIMYNIISSTATKGFKSKIYGQRHIAFEVVATKGLIHYYVAVPVALMDVVRQALVAAYPAARLEEVEEHNIFSRIGKLSGTIGGELTLKKDFAYPISTYQETKRDAMQAILNALSSISHEDGVAIQIMLRPARESWVKATLAKASKIKKDKGSKSGIGSLLSIKDLAEALWKPPETKDAKPEDKQLSTLEQATVDALEEKTRHPGYEVLIRVMASSNTAARSQAILKNTVAAFSLFDSPSRNGFKFSLAKNIESFVTSFIFRFFPQEVTQSILNSVELATVFHLPDQKNTPTSQLQRQMSKQVDGPYQTLNEGFLLGYNVFRGVKKEIRLATGDRRRHVYIIGQTGTGKSGLLENLALQDMLDGKGFAFVDPHGDSAERLLGMVPKERVEDVIYFSPGEMDHPIGLNLFEFDTEDQRDFLIQEAISMLYRLYDPGHTGIIGPRYEHWFRNAALTIMSDPNGTSFIDIPQVFNDNDFAKAKLKYVKDQTVLDFWNKEMAQTSDYHKSEVLGWFVSKFGAFLSNEMMRNILGQTKSGFNLRDIMDNKKILLVNLSKGKTGELNSQLLGMIFVMKFQAAAMGRADTPEDQRVDFSLYVDEFQNFATESFETILSEARKYRLNLILANQFMTQLTEKIREAIIGNVGTVISGRIGTTDAELMAKKFTPTFDAEDLTKLPNFETIASVMINNVPSAPFSMSLIPPLGHPNDELAGALKKLSAAKYGRPRRIVEQEIFKRLRAGEEEKKARQDALLGKTGPNSRPLPPRTPGGAFAPPTAGSTGSSFLDEWLAKRKQGQQKTPSSPVGMPQPSIGSRPPSSVSPTAPGAFQPTNLPPTNALNAGHYSAPGAMMPPSAGTVGLVATPRQQPANDKAATTPLSIQQDRLAQLQQHGIGSHIEVGDHRQAPENTMHKDNFEVEHAIQQTLNDEVMKSPIDSHGTLTVARNAPRMTDDEPEASDLDEIFVDLRGDLHHGRNDNDQEPPKKP